ncbi:alpha/beta hydrolase [Pantoea alhagi]|uniref:alpha/beta fold hydrolase n=1 Tax=Pantoea alhagi TaxID=1891675 RepID=UPI00202B9ED3|nr:alpha/beta hydrolase [Pantoea alhagi]URQ62236.1 alpha/beta hydrolase [Pantoea alhagi]
MLHTSGTPRLSYHAEGKGPLVIMLHGLLMDGKFWKDNGLISALSPFFHIVCPDLIGHGKSEKTNVKEFYTQQNQALSIVKIMDELGYKKAHVIGYSAGAWVALGLLNRFPERFNSVVLGGWDFKSGLPDTPEGKLSFDVFMSYARCVAPELTTSLSTDDEKSVRYFFDELRKYLGKEESFFPHSIPTLLWAGASDPYYASMAELAELHALPLLTGKGDHLSELKNLDKRSMNAILKFIQSPETFISSVT